MSGSLLTARTFLNTPSHSLDGVLLLTRLMKGAQAAEITTPSIEWLKSYSNTRPNSSNFLPCPGLAWRHRFSGIRPYFDRHGGAVVVALEPLLRAEMVAILTNQGVQDPASFLKEAHDRNWVISC